jgi:hypothetical protein
VATAPQRTTQDKAQPSPAQRRTTAFWTYCGCGCTTLLRELQTIPMLVTALIRYMYKELIDGYPAKLLLRPAQKFSQLHKLPSSTRKSSIVALHSLAHIILDSSGVVRSRPMVVNLVGLGGSLDSRVAGVVLELVGCGRMLVMLYVVRRRCCVPMLRCSEFHSCPPTSDAFPPQGFQ